MLEQAERIGLNQEYEVTITPVMDTEKQKAAIKTLKNGQRTRRTKSGDGIKDKQPKLAYTARAGEQPRSIRYM